MAAVKIVPLQEACTGTGGKALASGVVCVLYTTYFCIFRKSQFLSTSEIFFLVWLLISTWNAITEIINLKEYLVFQLAAFTSIKTYERNNLGNCCFMRISVTGIFLVLHTASKLLTFLMSFMEILLIGFCDIKLLCNTKIMFNDIIMLKWNHFKFLCR